MEPVPDQGANDTSTNALGLQVERAHCHKCTHEGRRSPHDGNEPISVNAGAAFRHGKRLRSQLSTLASFTGPEAGCWAAVDASWHPEHDDKCHNKGYHFCWDTCNVDKIDSVEYQRLR